MPTDPRSVVLNYFNPASGSLKLTLSNLTLEDGTDPSFYASMEMNEQSLRELHVQMGFDVAFIVDRRGNPHSIPEGGMPVAYVHELYVKPVVFDKWFNDDTRRLYATKLMDQCLQEIRRIIRENSAGSMRLLGPERSEYLRVGSTILFGPEVTIYYTQYVTAYGTYDVTTRRFFNYVAEWRVGTSSSSYDSVGPASGLGPVTWPIPDPWVELVIPGAATNVVQEINTGKKLEIDLYVRDRAAVLQLLETVDVDNTTAGTQTAIESNNTRTTIDYMVIVVYDTQITNATDARTTSTVSYSFTNTEVRDVSRVFDGVASTYRVRMYADSVTETVA